MALAIPEGLPRRASGGERRVFALLKRLPDTAIIYYEPLVDNRHPDFVVILPSLGVLLIEVKGWSFKSILAADSHSIRVSEDDREVVHQHPLRQVDEYKFRLMQECAKDRHFSRLLHLTGPHEGKLTFPVGSFAILSNTTRESLERLPKGREVFPAAKVVTKEQIDSWEGLPPLELQKALQQFFDPFWTISPLTSNQVNIVKALLHPEILLSLDFAPDHSEPNLRVLDARQESQARQVRSGHRLVFGVPGSGKTVLLLARAKLLARLNPSFRVLVLCYNVIFGAYLAETLKQFANVTVTSFHAWAAGNGAQWDKKDDSNLGSLLLEALRHGSPDSRRFDSVLIDEAQDFDADWFSCALAAMKDPQNCDLLIVGDGGQGVYRRRNKVSWKGLGIRAAGRTQYLPLNYRNTRPILRLAALFSPSISQGDEDGISSVKSDPEQCVRLNGPAPVLLKRLNKREEIERVVRVVDDLLEGKWCGGDVEPVKPEQIGILYPRLRKEDRVLIEDLRTLLRSNRHGAPSIWLNENSAARRRIGDPGIKILTMHGAKGLQFKAVILLFADECPANFPDVDEDDERRLFYVALTRAEEFLAVSCSKASKFIRDIKTAVGE